MKTYLFALGLLLVVASATPAAAQRGPRHYDGDHPGYYAPPRYAYRYAPRRYYGPRVVVVPPRPVYVRPLPPPPPRPVRVWVPGYWERGTYGRYWVEGYWVWR